MFAMHLMQHCMMFVICKSLHLESRSTLWLSLLQGDKNARTEQRQPASQQKSARKQKPLVRVNTEPN